MGSRSLQEYDTIITKTLAEYGIHSHRFEKGRKHTRCYFLIPGIGERFSVLPSSPGTGNNGPKNHRNDLRKLFNSLGVQPKAKAT